MESLATIESPELKTCAGCEESKSISEFGINAANINAGARDGLNIRCKLCIRQSVALHRASLRAYNVTHKRPALTPRYIQGELSPRRIARMLRKLSPADRVREAIRCGARTQKQIALVTRLPKDEIGEVLALLLLETREITTGVVNEVRYYAMRTQLQLIVPVPRKPMALSFASIQAIMPVRKQA